VYTYYSQLEESGSVALENLPFNTPAVEETVLRPEEGRKTYTEIEHDTSQYQPEDV
jgi:hypothetical protein